MSWQGLNPPYSTIVADPPWLYQKAPGSRGAIHSARGTSDLHYSSLTNEQLAELSVRELAADNAHLYLWVTNPGLYGGRFSSITPKNIAEAWGFEYKTMLTWHKVGGIGMGFYFRGDTEHVLFGVRGALPIDPSIRIRNWFEATKARHSVKPAAFYDLVERVSPGPYLELFARQPRLGWDSWGWGYELTAISAPTPGGQES